MYKKISAVLFTLSLLVSGASFAFGDNELRTRDTIRTNQGAEFSGDEILVKFKGADHAVRVRSARPTRDGVADTLAQYKNRSDVEYAEPNYIAHAMYVPNDPYYQPYQWDLDNPINGGIGMEEAWDLSKGQGVTVAVIDTGVAYENYSQSFRNKYYLAPDLANTTFVPGYDFVNNDTHPNDDEGHGTHVTGTIAQSSNNSVGVAGIAPEAKIMPVKVLNAQGSGTYAAIADGIRWAADHGAQVINMSLGGSSGSQTLEDALAYAYGKGVVIVAASGNDGAGTVSYPAAYDQYVIAVGATRFDKTRAPYSNYGSSLDIVAPGGDTTVDQNSDGYGDGILQQTFGNSTSNFGYYFYQGTSMATPHVAAVAALVLSHGNASTPSDVRRALEESADDLGAPGHDNVYGSGLLNAYHALLWNDASPPPPPPPNQAPTADAGSDKNAYVGSSVSFSGNGTDADGTIVSYAWDFGDGTNGVGQNVSHTYATTGVYTATLTVTDNDGATGSDSATVTITTAPATPTTHVSNIDMSVSYRGSRCKATGVIEVRDQNNQVVPSAAVFASWSGPYNTNVSGNTNSAGLRTFSTPWTSCNTFTLSVTNITKSGFSYNSALNTETSDSITP